MKYIQTQVFNSVAAFSSVLRLVGGIFNIWQECYPEYLVLAYFNIRTINKQVDDHENKKQLLLDGADRKVQEAHDIIGEIPGQSESE